MSTRSKADAPRFRGLPPHLAVLCRMLRSPEPDRRCAAAMVLAELSPRETAVVEALGESLPEENPTLTGYALDALERIGSRAALPYLLPLLERDEATRKRVQRVIAALGDPAITDVCRELAQSPRERRRALVHLLVEVDGKAALSAVLDTLLQDDPEHAEQVLQAYSVRWAGLNPVERAERREVLLHFLASPRVQGRKWPTSLVLRLLGILGDPEARRAVAPFARPRNPPSLRRAALTALRRLPPPKGKEEAAFAELCAYLTEEDLEHVVHPALEALRPLKTPAEATPVLKGLLGSPHATVRQFATERLGDLDDPAAATALVKVLHKGDPALAELAQDALRKCPAAVPALVRALKGSETDAQAWLLARLLAARAQDVARPQARAVAQEVELAIEKDDPRAEAMLHALRSIDPERYRQVVLKWGQRLLQQGKADEAARTLSPLDRGAEADVEARYALAVALLKASPKRLTRKMRQSDRALAHLRDLQGESDFPLQKRLTSDRTLSARDLFYVGFHFAEGDEGERELGRALLEQVVRLEPRSKLGESARNKLALVRRLEAAETGD
jgi:HEAT repeat protein